MEHFEISVSLEIQEKLKKLSELVNDDYISNFSSESNACRRINEISGVSYSGFIPFQKGGFEITEFYSNGYSSGIYLTKKEETWIDKQQHECTESFLKENNLPLNTNYRNLTDDQKNDLCEWEGEWLTPTILRLEIWVDDDDEIFFRLSAGYKDAPYYRAGYDETIKEFSMTQKDFLKKENEGIAKKIFTKNN